VAVAQYAYDQEWQEERERLRGIERLWDPGTQALLTRLGVGEGWRCLEVGAGGGSVSEWLADRVGDGGHVVACDVYTKFIDAIERPNVEVLQHDIVGGDLPVGDFDLVYSRLVVEHLGTPALERMAAALKPGGLLVLEDYDFASAGVFPEEPLWEKVTDAVLGFMSGMGFDPRFGRRLVTELTAAGLEDVAAEGRMRVFRGGEDETAFFRLSLETLRPALVEAGRLTEDEVAEALAMLDVPENTYQTPVLVSGWGRKPG
jgi:SAM-dependent methyltransferase